MRAFALHLFGCSVAPFVWIWVLFLFGSVSSSLFLFVVWPRIATLVRFRSGSLSSLSNYAGQNAPEWLPHQEKKKNFELSWALQHQRRRVA